jgi:hypothetical protein
MVHIKTQRKGEVLIDVVVAFDVDFVGLLLVWWVKRMQ